MAGTRGQAPAASALAVGYVRVSQTREEMISPTLQRSDINKWAARNPGVTVTHVVEDLDLSGRDFAKRQIEAIIASVKAGTVEKVLVYRYDRFGRNTLQALMNLARIEDAGGEVISVTEPMDASTAIGKYGRTNLLALAELQSDLIGEGWKRVGENRVKNGLPSDGRDRYGYVYHRASAPGGRVCPRGCGVGVCTTGYVVDPVTGPVLAAMYARYVAGDGINKVAAWLNADGVPTPRGKLWTPGTVSEKLDSGFGAGFVFADEELHPGIHEPVIDQTTWEAYRVRRDAQAPLTPRSRQSRTVLGGGLARCGRCGAHLNAVSQGKAGSQYLFRCSAEQLHGKSICPGVWLNRAVVEQAALDHVARWAEPLTEAAKAALAALPAPPLPDTAKERRRLELSLADVPAAMDRLTDALAAGQLDGAAYVAARSRQEAEAAQLRARLAALDADSPKPPARPRVRAFLNQWPGLSIAARRDVLGLLIAEVRVYPKDVEPRIKVVPHPHLL